MEAYEAIKEFKIERALVTAAIASLERAAASTGMGRRGRPPKWMAEAREAKERTRRGRPRKVR